MPHTQDIVQKLWNLCNILKDDGITYQDYVTELTYLLFLKMAHEIGKDDTLPKGYRWKNLEELDGVGLLTFYRRLLLHLGTEARNKRVKEIFADANTSLRQPRHLKELVTQIDAIEWFEAREEGILADLYEGLLEKNAQESKSGAGQYFTPRPLIDCMVDLLKPRAGELIQDPACGTAGFLIAADRYIKKETEGLSRLKTELQEFQIDRAFVGVELVLDSHRHALMNAMLHGIYSPIHLGDTLGAVGECLEKADAILTNPPFGTKKGGGLPTRTDFTYRVSNKQLCFLQHIYRGLKQPSSGKPGGRAAVVIPDLQGHAAPDVLNDLMDKLEKELDLKWGAHPLAPREKEQAPGLSSDGTRTLAFHNFCPEVIFDRFGLFATNLHRFHAETDHDIRRTALEKRNTPQDDPLWDWASFTGQHYSECPVYAPLSHDWPKHVRTCPATEQTRYDVFISHASEDKDDFVRPLAAALSSIGLRVWFDEWTLTLGDRLRERIDQGLGSCDYGVVVFSRNFFSKNWPKAELEGLFAREMQGKKVILPIWHNVTKAEVLEYSPMLAGKLAAPTTEGAEAVARKIYAVVRPNSGPMPPLAVSPAIQNATQTNTPEVDHVKTVTQRFTQIFNDHGIATTQIPRFTSKVTLDKLRNPEALASVLAPEVLDFVAIQFGIRRLWLDGIDDQIYERESCYKDPEKLFHRLIEIRRPESFYALSAIIDCDSLDMNAGPEQHITLVVTEHAAYLGAEEICRFSIYKDGFHWDYWKCRHQLKAMARIYSKATDEIVPLYVVTPKQRAEVESGLLVPREILDGQHDLDRNLEDYAVFPGEGTGAPEMEEAQKVQEYIQEHDPEKWSEQLKRAWAKK